MPFSFAWRHRLGFTLGGRVALDEGEVRRAPTCVPLAVRTSSVGIARDQAALRLLEVERFVERERRAELRVRVGGRARSAR